MIRKFDFLVIGSGVAGMSYALKVADAGKGKVAIVCKTTLEEANTAKAQGGIASVTNLKVDNFEKHIKDTMVAGDFISNPAAVEQVVKNAPQGIRDLVKWGVNFDKNEKGDFDLHREGGHSEFRILHHGQGNPICWHAISQIMQRKRYWSLLRTSRFWKTTLPWKSSPNTIWASK